MKNGRIISSMLAAVLAISTFAFVPTVSDGSFDIAVTASAAGTNGLVINDDGEGTISVGGYTGTSPNVVIPANVDYIESHAVWRNETIKTLTIEGDIWGINDNAFAECTNLEKVVIKGDLKSYDGKGGIQEYAFFGCKKLKEVVFEKKDAVVDQIGDRAFENCYSLNKINIPSSTVKIEECAFQNCEQLASVTIPEKTVINGTKAFGYVFGIDGNKSSVSIDDIKDFLHYKLIVANGSTPIYSVDSMLDGIVTKIIQKKITLNVYKGSPAEKWAKENKIAYKIIEKETASASNSSDKPAAPQNVKASAKTTDSITLKWDSVDGADAYAVYKYNSSTKKYEKYKTVTKATCKVTGLKKGTKYQFKVKALKKNGKKYITGGTSKAVAVSTSKK